MSFTDHVGRARDKAERSQAAIGRLFPDVGGPDSAKRRVLVGIVQSIVLYAVPV